ncbi:hypothetical protein [Acinetobacter lwoffii]|uniref:hypothetical protein n=1 Tax=Acinetobacter lwoffii TaxID=28090 RepID=UPI0002D0D708|nr:hypothetical protein [Acinetobacter lwoffii]ENW30350.1 hypothetical protein F924_00379 [Acinetobacter lwoffii ATCC 9957 = CIP 70.31]
MSLDQMKMSKAELQFYEAFIRLKENKPVNVTKGTSVTQNNVAKEAGVDPSALRKSRYPELIKEIQAWIELNDQKEISKKQARKKSNSKVIELQQKIEIVVAQRDQATSKLLAAQLKIIELTNKIKRLDGSEKEL